MKLARVLVGLAGLTLMAGVLGTPPKASAADGVAETVGDVANTWTNYTNGGGDHGPSIQAYTTVSIACKVHGLAVQNGNDWWYRIASEPWSGQYYVSADAFYNNGSTSGSLVGTPWFDPAVPDCGEEGPTAPEPAASPTVHLERGLSYGSGYWYSVSLADFEASQDVSVSCRDSADPGGFYSSRITTGKSGNGSASRFCRSEDSGEHWVVAEGIESNHITWTASRGSSVPKANPDPSASPKDGRKPSPSPTQKKSATTPEACNWATGTTRLSSKGTLAESLYWHYEYGGGTSVVVDWSYFSTSDSFRQIALELPLGGSRYYRNDPRNTDMFYALGSFTVKRTGSDCYQIYDHYDFKPDFSTPAKSAWTVVTLPSWADQLVGAREFDIRAAGKL